MSAALAESLELAGGSARRIKKGRAAGSAYLQRKFKVSSGATEAVFKITSYAKSPGSVKNMVDYISRDGDLELLDQDGNAIQDDYERESLVDIWSDEFGNRKDARLATHMVVSTPEGSDKRKTKAAAAEWGRENLADYQYVFVLHDDEPHPHCHFIVARKMDGPPLKFSKADMDAMRQSWAEIGTKHKIPMVASSRLERGQTRKASQQSAIHIRKRDGYTKMDLAAAKEVLSEASSDGANPWLNETHHRLAQERAEYEEIAGRIKLLLKSKTLDATLKAQAKVTLRSVNRQAMALRQVRTRRAVMREIVDGVARPDITVKSSPKELAIAYAADGKYQKQVVTPLGSAPMKAEIAKVGDLIGAAPDNVPEGVDKWIFPPVTDFAMSSRERAIVNADQSKFDAKRWSIKDYVESSFKNPDYIMNEIEIAFNNVDTPNSTGQLFEDIRNNDKWLISGSPFSFKATERDKKGQIKRQMSSFERIVSSWTNDYRSNVLKLEGMEDNRRIRLSKGVSALPESATNFLEGLAQTDKAGRAALMKAFPKEAKAVEYKGNALLKRRDEMDKLYSRLGAGDLTPDERRAQDCLLHHDKPISRLIRFNGELGSIRRKRERTEKSRELSRDKRLDRDFGIGD